MSRNPFRRYFRKRTLLAGFIAVLVPLVVLLLLQYRWLARLEHTTAIAEEAWLDEYLDAVTDEVASFYRTQAERSLSLPGYLFTDRHVEQIEPYLRKKAARGAKYLFAIRYIDRSTFEGRFHIYDTRGRRAGIPRDVAALQAMEAAIAPWRAIGLEGSPVPSYDLRAYEFDPENRILLNPITDNANQLLGVAGMVVDNDYFSTEVLPATVERKLDRFFKGRDHDSLIVTVRDGMGRNVYGRDEDLKGIEQVTSSFSLLFTDWRVAVGGRYTTPKQWARSNFMLNMSLSVVLALLLLGGVVLAFRTASHEIRLSEMKADFVSNVSHELRTPLASIRVFGEFLRLGRVDDESKIREYGEYIEIESRRLTQLISNILDFAKIESEAKTYDIRAGDIRAVLAESVRTLAVGLRHNGFTLAYEEGSGPFPPMEIDPSAIGQAVANLVDNAVKYSGDGREVQVSLQRVRDEVLIQVADRGIGISKDEQGKVFERFHRVGNSLVHDVKGSGLGLSIVSHIVAAHGGRVSLVSEPGNGSMFTIHLPLLPCPAQGVAALGAAPGMGEG